MKLPSCLLFDLGGVIINIDFERTLHALMPHLQPNHWHSLHTWQQLSQQPFFYAYETGQIDTSSFYQHLLGYTKADCQIQHIEQAWMALLLDIPAARIELLQYLRQQGYQLWLLSNTNPAHIERIQQMLHAQFHTDLSKLFDRLFLSYEIGLTKPNPSIYQYVLQATKQAAHNILFLDDSLANLKAAQDLGFQVYHVQPNALRVEELSAYAQY